MMRPLIWTEGEEMSEVKRYDIEADTPYACIHHYGRADGDWVKFEDYAALQHKLETVLAENVDLKAGADKCYDEITSIHNSYGWSVSEDGESETAVIDLESALFVLNENIIDIKTPATDAFLNELRAGAIAAVPTVCDGKEQAAFEAYAQSKGLDLSQHPLHYLLLDEKTNQARSAWRECLNYVAAQLRAGRTEGGV